jgi:hypothetical protein
VADRASRRHARDSATRTDTNAGGDRDIDEHRRPARWKRFFFWFWS